MNGNDQHKKGENELSDADLYEYIYKILVEK